MRNKNVVGDDGLLALKVASGKPTHLPTFQSQGEEWVNMVY